MIVKKICVKLSISVLCLLFFTQALSQESVVLGVIGSSIAIDQAGDELRESIDHAHAAASSLLGRADNIAKRRLEQIDNIIDQTIGGLIDKSEEATLRVIKQAMKEVAALEKEIFLDVKKAIWEFDCAGRRLMLSDAQQVLGGFGDMLGTHQIRLTPSNKLLETPKWYSGCLWWCKDPYVVKITEPFGKTYVQVRDLMEASISDEHILDDTPANNLVETYEYLSSFALKTSCFYQGSEDRYNREYIKYREMARKWNNVVNVPLQ